MPSQGRRFVEDVLEHFQKKRSRSAGEIKHSDAVVVGEAVGDLEAVFQDVVDSADDEIHDGRRRVIDAAALRVSLSYALR